MELFASKLQWLFANSIFSQFVTRPLHFVIFSATAPPLILPPRRPNLAPRNRFTYPLAAPLHRHSIPRRFTNVRFLPPAQAALRCLAHGC
ncbi:hypothetical protein EMIT0P43_50159 [Pseudomonas jessenii]